ncbi:MAG: tetratricopeptide repeat protein [Hydrococcus sp. C42_A2020_068]|nr:tetratricopeptide repeat protein [Hydrococcus sp. C42_A2020_068]
MAWKSTNPQFHNQTITLSDGQNVFHFSPTPILDISAEQIKSRPLISTSPYKGLKPFTAKDCDYFFGRDKLTFHLLEELCKKNLILLLGASGSGKTSVIQAGLLPRIRNNLPSKFIEVICYPNRNPFVSLFKVLVRQNCNPEEAELILREEVDGLSKFFQVLQARNDGSYWLIFIDRFEELLTISATEKTDKFIDSLIHLYNHLDRTSESFVKIKIILAIKTEFLDKISAYPQFLDITIDRKNIRAIANIDPNSLRLAIEQPAARNGVIFEEELVSEILKDIREYNYSLPLLQHALNLLWHSEDLDKRTLKLSTYRQLGKIEKALQNQSNRVYNSLSKLEQIAAKKIFLKLVKIVDVEESGREGIAVSQRAELSNFNDEISQTAIVQLIEGNLLTCDRATNSVEIIHETLLHRWKFLRDWLEEARQVLVIKKQLTEAADAWKILSQEDREQANTKLWYGSKLEKACELRNTWLFNLAVDGLSPDEDRFLDASLARQNQALKSKETQIQQLNRILDETKLREQAARAQNLLPVRPLEGLVLAIQTTGENADKFPQQMLPVVQTCLNSAMEIAREQNIFQGHDDRVKAVAVSPDGQIIVSGSWDKTLRLWDRQGNAIGQPFRGHEGDVTSVAFSPDGQTIVSGSGDGTVRLWNLEGNAIARPFLGHQGDVTSVAFSPDGQTIVSGGGDGTVRLWDRQGNPIGLPFEGHEGDVTSVAFSPDGQTIVSGGGDGTVRLWDLFGDSIGEPFRGHEDKVAAVAFSPDGEKIASGSWDTTVRLWDLQGKTIGRPFRGHEDYVIAIAFDPEGKLIASGSSDKVVRLWDLSGNPIGQPLRGHTSSVRSLAFSPDGQTVTSASTDKSVRLWDLRGNALHRPIQGHEVSVWSVAFSPTPVDKEGKEEIFATGGGDGTVRLWDLSGNPIGQPLRGHAGDVTSVAFSPDGQTIASGSWDRTIRLWNLAGNPIARPFQGHENDVTSVAFSPDGEKIASGSWDKTIRLWDLKGNLIARPFRGHEGDVTSVVFSPDGEKIASGSWDKTIRLWDLKGNLIARPFQGHRERVNSVAFSPDGQVIVSGGGDGTIRLWDLSGNPIGEPFRGHESYVTSVAFNPDGQTIVSGGGDGTIRLWDLSGNPIAQPFEIYKSEATSVAFSSNGQILVGSSLNGKVYLWRGGGWRSWLQVCCDRLRYHPAFKNPQTEIEKQACQVCQKHVWNREATEWNKQGILKLEGQDFQAALDYFNRALEIDPYHRGVLYNRARVYANLGNFREAIRDLERIIEGMPTHAAAYFYRSQCYAELGDRSVALKDCQQAVFLYQQQGQGANYQKAIAYLHRLQR